MAFTMTQTEKELFDRICILEERHERTSHEIMAQVRQNNEELYRLNEIVRSAIVKAVHELIEYLRQEDIHSLDEQEFAQEVERLIFEAEPNSYLPF